jgi:hypothetical protein
MKWHQSHSSKVPSTITTEKRGNQLKIAWCAIARGEVVLVEVYKNSDSISADAVASASQGLIKARYNHIGVVQYTLRQHGALRLQGLKLLVHDRDSSRFWTFAMIYCPDVMDVAQAQVFLENLVDATELDREMDDEWKTGACLACQQSFAPNLHVYIDKVNYSSLHEINSEIDRLKDLMMDNIDAALDRGVKLEGLQEKADELERLASIFQDDANRLKQRKKRKLITSGVLIVGAAVAVCAFPPLLIIIF